MTTNNFIVGTGRCGTSLLAHVLSQCGADFGPVKALNRFKDGYMENTAINDANMRIIKYYELRESFPFVPIRLLNWIRNRSLKTIECQLGKRTWVKSPWLTDTLRDIIGHDNIEGKILGIVRHPSEYALSLWRSSSQALDHHTSTRIWKKYVERNMNLLLLLETHGGCIISFHDLLNPRSDKWAKKISKAFGEFSAKDLVHARNKLVDKHAKHVGKRVYVPEEVQELWEYLEKKSLS